MGHPFGVKEMDRIVAAAVGEKRARQWLCFGNESDGPRVGNIGAFIHGLHAVDLEGLECVRTGKRDEALEGRGAPVAGNFTSG